VLCSLVFPASVWAAPAINPSEIISTAEVTIPAGQTGSTSFNLAGRTIAGFLLNYDPTGNVYELTGSLDDSVFYSLFNSAAQQALYDVSQNQGIYSCEGEGESAKYIKINSDIAEASERTITFILV
jgi:hypothetical protein